MNIVQGLQKSVLLYGTILNMLQDLANCSGSLPERIYANVRSNIQERNPELSEEELSARIQLELAQRLSGFRAMQPKSIIELAEVEVRESFRALRLQAMDM